MVHISIEITVNALLPSSSIYTCNFYQFPLTAAVFSFTETSYDVSEDAGPAVVVVELSGADLTFAIDVTVLTVGGGSATGTCYLSFDTLSVHALIRDPVDNYFTINPTANTDQNNDTAISILVTDDYNTTSQVLTFGATSVRGATMTAMIRIVDDDLVEMTETINVMGSVTEPLANFQPSQTVVNILNDDGMLKRCCNLV